MTAKTRKKPRRFPETQVRLRLILDELRLLRADVAELRGLVFAGHAVPVPTKADE
jgi:hypothetical protein